MRNLYRRKHTLGKNPFTGKSLFILFLWTALQSGMYAQHHEHESEGFKRHRISLVMGHTHIPRGIESADKKSSLIVPSWGLNYDFWFTPRWAIGSHNDMEISTYVIEDHHETEIERERPVILTLVGIFKPTHHIELLAGFGREFEKHHNFWVYRLGIEYEFDLPGHWLLSPALIFDFKEDVYNSISLGIVIGKKF